MPELSPEPGRKADLSNWRTAPFSRWAFRNVGRIIPTAPIRAAAEPRPLPEDLQSFADFRLAAEGGTMLGLDEFLGQTATDAFLVLRDGRIVFEFYADGMDAKTPHILMSASKSVTGLLAGLLGAEGLIDPDAPVSDLAPEVAGSAYRGATLRHLLDMRTGVVLDERELRAYAAAANWDPVSEEERGIDLHSFLSATKAAPRPHGGPFSYVSANTDLLGWALERAGGKSFAELVSERIWKPMGAEQDASITLDRSGSPRCTGGVSATARDMARLGQLLLEKGSRDGKRIVPADWIDDVVTQGDREAWAKGDFAPAFGGMTMSHRGNWYTIHDAPRTLFAMGIHGQNLFVDLENGIVIVKLSSLGLPIDIRALTLTHRAVPAIAGCLSR